MNIGIDFDGTYAAKPEFFRALVALAKDHGITPYVITQRCAMFRDEVRSVVGLDIEVIWASGQTKEDAARRAGVEIDVWMDDNPLSVKTPLIYRGC